MPALRLINITATLRLHYGYNAAAFLNCGCITCISVQQNFEVLTPRLFVVTDAETYQKPSCLSNTLSFMGNCFMKNSRRRIRHISGYAFFTVGWIQILKLLSESPIKA
jgi:hypothetical protein